MTFDAIIFAFGDAQIEIRAGMVTILKNGVTIIALPLNVLREAIAIAEPVMQAVE